MDYLELSLELLVGVVLEVTAFVQVNYIYAVAFFAMMTATVLRGVQNKNVQGGFRKSSFLVGGIMTLFEYSVIGLIAQSGSYIIVFAAAGSACGWVLGITLHERVMRKHYLMLKTKKKSKRAKRMERAIDNRLRELGYPLESDQQRGR